MQLTYTCHVGYKLDKKHTFSVTLMEDFDMIMKTQPEWVAPQEDDYDEEAVSLGLLLAGVATVNMVLYRCGDAFVDGAFVDGL
jgi:hypothetical protein